MVDEISKLVGSLPPGFRFDPTGEELLNQYLKPKIREQPGKHNEIKQIDACELEPAQCSTEFGHIFFCRLKPKPSKNKRPCYNRKTSGGGYWKVTSKDRPIMSKGTNEKIGIMKTLVFHRGNSAKNESSNWVCHEYHLNHNEDEKSEPYVVCWIKEKKEKKLITALASTISPEGSSSRPHAYTGNVSGTPVNQEGDHSSFCNTLNNGVAGNQEAVNAQPETSAEEFMRPPILHPGDTLADDILANPAGDGSSIVLGLLNDDLRMPTPCSDPANHLSFGTSPDHDIFENRSCVGWESGTV